MDDDHDAGTTTPASFPDRRRTPMRGSSTIWTIVGVLLIIALVVWLISAL